MKQMTINIETLKLMMKNAANNLYNHHEYINDLNVFPVPDGDTGTNMNLTMSTGYESLRGGALTSINNFSKAVTHGMLMGARGNSGVILSQFFRGFFEACQNSKDEIDVPTIIQAFESAKARSYASVVNAIEGTMLTVVRVVSEKLSEECSNSNIDMAEIFELIVKTAEQTTIETQEMLQALKDAGVVDSGAKGLSLILEGFQKGILGEEINKKKSIHSPVRKENIQPAVEEFGFCTEFLIKLYNDVDVKDVKVKLTKMKGESIVLVKSEDILKVHVHVENPIEVFNYGLTLGEFVKIKAENMTMQSQSFNEDKHLLKIPKIPLAVVTTARGNGLVSHFYEMGAERVIDTESGAPSVDAFLKEIEAANAKTVIILTNDKNYIFAAEEAKKASENVRVRLVQTKSIPEGLTALSLFDSQDTLRENMKTMKRAIKNIKTIQLTRSVKDTVSNNVEIKKDDVIIIENGKIIGAGSSEIELIKKYVENEQQRSSVDHINVVFGKQLNDVARKSVKEILGNYRLAEKNIIDSDNPLYSLVLGIE